MVKKISKMENISSLSNLYRGKKILVTGHTGFKGSWISLWLKKCGAEVSGLALDPSDEPSHFSLLKLDMKSFIGDIRDRDFVRGVLEEVKPEIIFHLAAQAIVFDGFENPLSTFETNFNGTLNLLEACRCVKSIKGVVVVTTDKVYRAKNGEHPFVEDDPLGGIDPYSASKSCVEILVSSYRNSFFNPAQFGEEHDTLIATARAGNVIGGGDWGKYRIIPDLVRASCGENCIDIRNPDGVRPWQHVLECLHGYLLLGCKLLNGNKEFARSWNFGPGDEKQVKVSDLVNLFSDIWKNSSIETSTESSLELTEVKSLELDSNLARKKLLWKKIWSIEKGVRKTVRWYHDYHISKIIRSSDDIDEYIRQVNSNL